MKFLCLQKANIVGKRVYGVEVSLRSPPARALWTVAGWASSVQTAAAAPCRSALTGCPPLRGALASAQLASHALTAAAVLFPLALTRVRS